MHRKLSRVAAVASATAVLAIAGTVNQATAAVGLQAKSALPATTAAGGPDSGQFSIAPVPASDGAPRGYFMMTLDAGATARDEIVLTNGGTTPLQLKVGTTNGTTATNSGSAFENLPAKCTGAACWVTGLPATVTVPPHTRESLPFRVAVPAGTQSMQYLAGITAQPAARSKPVSIKSSGHAATRVVIVTQITIGVAVTVGSLASLPSKVAITGITANWIGTLVRLSADVRNEGERFTKGTGRMSCTLGGTAHTYPVSMGTVLPGDGAVLPVNGTGMRAGAWQCTLKIEDSGGTTDTWSGSVTVPDTKQAAPKQVAKGDYAFASDNGGIPAWAITLMVLGGLIVLSLWAVLLRRGRNRHHDNPDPQ
jgi:hypothetical protein